ncbi:AAA family ATPase [uncultured Streptococcus sp.]|uniref:AAA family ATPase n=1 Tax=Streptococcus infantis TaxID=68892 RepID=UPI00288AF9FA|nr:AAA family ATPase [uncultured Streptococcus sp.]
MKIKKIQINGLHGYFQYDIDLNEDISLLYGKNGSGKTTVLNLIEFIIGGEFYKLKDILFHDVIITTTTNNILKLKNTNEAIVLKFLDDEKTIYFKELERYFSTERYRGNGFNKHQFVKEYPIVQTIRDSFDYVYLPLERISNSRLSNNEQFSEQSRIIHKQFYRYNSKDASMDIVKYLVDSQMRHVNYKIRELNEKFRNDVLETMFVLTGQQLDFSGLISYFRNENVLDELNNLKEKYVTLLRDLNIINNTNREENNYLDYFEKLLNDVEELNSEKNKDRGIEAKFVATYNEIEKIKKITLLASESETMKKNARKSIDQFIEIVNTFLLDGEDGKNIKVTNDGTIYFETSYTDQKVDITYLSSGEKQLVNLFANFIFKVSDMKNGIFVADEPELSLHLRWQTKFIKQLHEINPNIQLIFATHSPELVGPFRNKIIKIQKYYRKIQQDISFNDNSIIDSPMELDDLDELFR